MYRFILQRNTTSGVEDIEFPLAPEQFKTKVGNKNKTIEIVPLGEVNVLKDIGLRTFSFKVLLPKDETLITGTKNYVDSEGSVVDSKNWTTMQYHEPIWYLSRIREMKADKTQPVFLVIIRELITGYDDYGKAIIKRLFDGNLTVSIEDYTVEENAGEEGDWWVTLNLKEWRTVDVIKHIEETGTTDDEGKTEAVEVAERQDTVETEDTYTIKSGDSLWDIAKAKLGDGSKWKEIWELNKDKIPDPEKIYPGTEIILKESDTIHEPTIDEGSYVISEGNITYK